MTAPSRGKRIDPLGRSRAGFAGGLRDGSQEVQERRSCVVGEPGKLESLEPRRLALPEMRVAAKTSRFTSSAPGVLLVMMPRKRNHFVQSLSSMPPR